MGFLVSAGFSMYGFIIGMGMLVCILAAYYLAKWRGYNADLVFTIAVICLPCAILGARIYYIVFDIIGGDASVSSWFSPNGNFTLMRFIGFNWTGDGWEWRGLEGLAIYGGLIAAVFGAIIVRQINKRDKNPKNHMTFIQMLDAFFVLIILGQVIGRWGNFANDEAYGNVVTNPKLQWFPYAYDSAREGAWVQATFFWESALNLIGFFALLYLCYGKKRRSYDGFIFAAYCFWYGLVRLIVEGQRSDSLYTSSGFNIFIGVMLVVAAVGLVAYSAIPAVNSLRKGERQNIAKDLAPRVDLLIFGGYCAIRGLILLFGGEPLRISQFVSGLLIVWGLSSVVGHIIKAKTSGKKIFIHAKMSDLSTDYYGYEKTIMFINQTNAEVLGNHSDTEPTVEVKTENVKATSGEITDDSVPADFNGDDKQS